MLVSRSLDVVRDLPDGRCIGGDLANAHFVCSFCRLLSGYTNNSCFLVIRVDDQVLLGNELTLAVAFKESFCPCVVQFCEDEC